MSSIVRGRVSTLLHKRWGLPTVYLVVCGLSLTLPTFLPNFTLGILVVTLFAAFAMVMRWNEQTVLGLLLAAGFLIPTSLSIEALGQVGIPSMLIGLLLLLLWLYGRCTPELGLDSGPQPVRYMALYIMIALFASYIAGQLRGMSSLEASGADATMIFVASSLGMLLFTADTIKDMTGVRRLLGWLVGLGVILSVTGMLQNFQVIDIYRDLRIPGMKYFDPIGLESLAREGYLRVQGLAGHPIEFSVVLGMLLPIALHFALHSPREQRLRWWAAVAVIGAGLPMALSRSGILAAGVSLIIYLLATRVRVLATLVPVGLVGVLGMSLVFPGLLGSIRNLFLFGYIANDTSISSRTDDYAIALKLWADYPVFGTGPGTYIPKLYRILDNGYLYYLITQGVFGLLGLVGLFACGYFLVRRIEWTTKDPHMRDLAQALAGSIAGAALVTATFDSFGFNIMFVTTHFLVGIAGVMWRVSIRDRDKVPLQ